MRVMVTIPEELDSERGALASRENISKSEAFRRALNLVKIANHAHARGDALGIIREDPNQLVAIGKLVGV